MKGNISLSVTLLVLCLASVAMADDIRGYLVPEYYVVGSHHEGEEGPEGQAGFWFRRIYLGYNSDLGKGWSARVRFEMNSPQFESDKLVPYVKNAHVKKKLGGGANLIIGIQDPPSFNRIEKVWGFRFIEKTAPDFYKFASSRDFGIALDGKSKKGLVYTLMFGNYGSSKGESNKGKAFYGRLGYEKKTAYVEANGHYAGDGSQKVTYLTLFGGLKGDWGKFGVGYHYLDKNPDEGESQNSGIISGFGTFKIGKKTELFARYDHFSDLGFKDISGIFSVLAKQFKARYVIAGLNFKIHDKIKVSPNIRYVFYDGDGAPDGDFYFSLTAKIDFKTSIGKK